MTRELHEMDVCELSDASLEAEIRAHMHGDGLAIVVEDERLTPLVPIHGQQTLFGDELDFGDNVEVFTAPLPPRRETESEPVQDDQTTLPGGSYSQLTSDSPGEVSVERQVSLSDDEPHFPRNSDEQFHFESNSHDSLVTMFPVAGYFQRGPPFLDMTRIVREGGSIVAVTGLRPDQGEFSDAKWWVPDSDDVELDVIRILRHEECKTPVVVSVFSVVSGVERHPDATIVSEA